MRPPKDVGHRARQHHADGGQTGDDHGNTQFQPGPDQRAVIVPGGVPAGGEVDDETEADAAGQKDEEAQAEHEEDLGPFAHGCIQIGEEWDWHHENDDILCDAETGRGVR